VLDEHTQFFETPFVQKHIDALASGKFPFPVLLVNTILAPPEPGLLTERVQMRKSVPCHIFSPLTKVGILQEKLFAADRVEVDHRTGMFPAAVHRHDAAGPEDLVKNPEAHANLQ
jgi:hypothetical protein